MEEVLLLALLLFVGFDLSGNWIQHHFGLPVPGPLIGLILLTTALVLRPQLSTRGMKRASAILIGGLSMFFVPAGTGVITQLHEIRLQWLPISAALIVSTAGALVVTAWVMRVMDAGLVRWLPPDAAEAAGSSTRAAD